MAAPEGDDVVGQGPDDGPPRAPRWLRRGGLAAAVLLVGLGLSRAGLLSSADEPSRGDVPDGSPSGSAATAGPEGPRLVARLGDRLLVAAPGGASPGARLPRGLQADARLVPVRPGGADVDALTPGPLVGAHDGRLFRADADRARYRTLGSAEAVVAAGSVAARAVVERDGRLQEVEVATGATTDADPFPGFVPQRWSALGALGGAGAGAVLMVGPGTDGERVLALAYPRTLVESGRREPVRELGSFGELLGIADDWALTLGPGCPGKTCTLVVVSVTRDASLARAVAPPPGWAFVRGPVAGRTHEALVPVRRLDGGAGPGDVALARLVPGGDNALLVQGTDRVRLSAGLADGPGGSVYLLHDQAGPGDPRAAVWDPDRPNAAAPVLPAVTFPAGARLVCACG